MLHCRYVAGACRKFVVCVQILRYSRKYPRNSHPGNTQGMRLEYYPLRTICHPFQLVVSDEVEFWLRSYATPLPLIWKQIEFCQSAHNENRSPEEYSSANFLTCTRIRYEYTDLSTDNGLCPTYCLVHLMFVNCYTRQTGGRNTVGVYYNERMLQGTVFINKIRMLQRTQMLQRKRRNTIGRGTTRVRMTCRALPLWLERQSSSLLSSVRCSYQFSWVICLFVQQNKLILYYFYTHIFDFVQVFVWQVSY